MQIQKTTFDGLDAVEIKTAKARLVIVTAVPDALLGQDVVSTSEFGQNGRPSLAELGMFFDCTWYEAADAVVASSPMRSGARHFDGIDVCYGDGHVKWQGMNRIYDLLLQ